MARVKITENIGVLREMQRRVDILRYPQRSRVIATLIHTDIKNKITNEKDVSGKRFKPLSKTTIEIKKEQDKIPYKIMRDTGELINSLNYSISSDCIKIGYSVAYADKHQFGTKRLPIRKILPTKEDEIPIAKIKRIIKNYVKGL